MKTPLILKLYESQLVQIILAGVIYALYASVLGIALAPSVWLMVSALDALNAAGTPWSAGGILMAGLAAGAAVYVYFLWGACFMALMVRIISAGTKPGRYAKTSFTTIRWLIHSGIHTIAMRSILPFIPVSYFCNLYFKILGAKIAKNVYINTPMVADAYLLTLEEGVIIGGNAEVTCHIMERDHLVLSPIRIGRDSLVGTGAYVSPGVDIGARCTIGARCYIRRGVTIPDGSIYTVIAGLPIRSVYEIEKGSN